MKDIESSTTLLKCNALVEGAEMLVPSPPPFAARSLSFALDLFFPILFFFQQAQILIFSTSAFSRSLDALDVHSNLGSLTSKHFTLFSLALFAEQSLLIVLSLFAACHCLRMRQNKRGRATELIMCDWHDMSLICRLSACFYSSLGSHRCSQFCKCFSAGTMWAVQCAASSFIWAYLWPIWWWRRRWRLWFTVIAIILIVYLRSWWFFPVITVKSVVVWWHLFVVSSRNVFLCTCVAQLPTVFCFLKPRKSFRWNVLTLSSSALLCLRSGFLGGDAFFL